MAILSATEHLDCAVCRASKSMPCAAVGALSTFTKLLLLRLSTVVFVQDYLRLIPSPQGSQRFSQAATCHVPVGVQLEKFLELYNRIGMATGIAKRRTKILPDFKAIWRRGFRFPQVQDSLSMFPCST